MAFIRTLKSNSSDIKKSIKTQNKLILGATAIHNKFRRKYS